MLKKSLATQIAQRSHQARKHIFSTLLGGEPVLYFFPRRNNTALNILGFPICEHLQQDFKNYPSVPGATRGSLKRGKKQSHHFNNFSIKYLLLLWRMADAECFSCDHIQHEPGFITCQKQWEEQHPWRSEDCMWNHQEPPLLYDLHRPRDHRSEWDRKSEREDGVTCPILVWQAVSSVRGPMGHDGYRDQIVEGDNTLHTCLSWAVSLTIELLQARKYQLPKELALYVPPIGGCKTWWWEGKQGEDVHQTSDLWKSSCRKKEKNMSRGSTAWWKNCCQDITASMSPSVDSCGPKSFTCSEPFQSPQSDVTSNWLLLAKINPVLQCHFFQL